VKTVAIIQARMGSTRLSNKMMLHLHGYPVCEWVYRRVQLAKSIDKVVFALPDTKDNDVLASFLESIKATVFRGSETDLVERFYLAAKYFSADQIVRVCGDNPLICASEIDKLVVFFESERCNYAYNHIPKDNFYPDGLGAEICSMQLLVDIFNRAKTGSQREHLFNTIWDHKHDYSIKTFDPDEGLAHPNVKFDIDTIDDYNRLLQKPYRINMSALELLQTALD
jgi:spore coat polysaccharide biosynthesis protein SpsF